MYIDRYIGIADELESCMNAHEFLCESFIPPMGSHKWNSIVSAIQSAGSSFNRVPTKMEFRCISQDKR